MIGVELRADAAEIRRALTRICEPGAVYELRSPTTSKATVSGYYDDLDAMLRGAAVLTDGAQFQAPGVYFTINPVRSDLLARANNRLKLYAKHTTADADIVVRRWLLLDFDPTRPAGISATDQEHESASARARQCAEMLNTEYGWPAPIFADSGNGAHLLFPIDLQNDDAARELVKRVLEALANLFDDAVVKVDRTTFNAARIWKLYGTIARKGDSTPGRPHRLARILEAPDSPQIASREQLAEVAALAPTPTLPAHGAASSQAAFDLERWTGEHAIPVKRSEPWNGGTRYILDACPFDATHVGTSAAILQLASGAIAFKCQHNGCVGRAWADLRAKFEPDRAAGSTGAAEEVKPQQEVAKKAGKPSQADTLIMLARKRVELFHDGDAAYAILTHRSHHEVWPLQSKSFRDWLFKIYFEQEKKAPNAEAVRAAVNTLAGFARFGSNDRAAPEHKVFVRLAESGGKIYLDLADCDWRAVEIDADGWRLLDDPAAHGVYFRRPRGMLPLPPPERGGSIRDLRKFVNVADDRSFVLMVAWLIAAYRARGPYPVLPLHGEQGSAKSTLARYLRALIDPNIAPARGEPKEVGDLMIAAANGWIISLENLSYLSPWLSDALCRLSTGGGLSKRELYTDGDEVLLDAKRPAIINAIEELATRGDLLDRAIVLTLPTIPDDERRPEDEIDAEFEKMRPGLLGALLGAVSCALRNVGTVKLDKYPRMADFAKWVVAAEPALPWAAGEFLAAYRANRDSANVVSLEASAIYAQLLAIELPFEGAANELLGRLHAKFPDATKPPKGWPANARSLSNALRRIAPNLRREGIEVIFYDQARPRRITIARSAKAGNFASNASDATGEKPPAQCSDGNVASDASVPDDGDRF
jgi:hypothetical protein